MRSYNINYLKTNRAMIPLKKRINADRGLHMTWYFNNKVNSEKGQRMSYQITVFTYIQYILF